MRFSGGTLSLLLTATAVAASVFQPNQNPSSIHAHGSRSTQSLFGVASSKLDANVALSEGIVAVPRGGSVATDDADEDAEDAEESGSVIG